MLKHKLFIGLIVSLFATSIYGSGFIKKATGKPLLVQNGTGKQWCSVCGMKIKNYYKTSYTAKLKAKGTTRQYCSMRCLVVDMKKHGIAKESIKVIDVKSEKYIKAQKAYFVVGSKVAGTMSRVSKLAFKNKHDAQKFIKNFKGKIVSFNIALKMAQNSLAKDNSMMLKMRIKRAYPRGKRIFEKVCNKEKINLRNYKKINELKQDIVDKKLCKPLKEKDLQAVALYIWKVKKSGVLKKIEDNVQVTKNEKCPVCGMYIYKYPRWATQIFYEKKGNKYHLSFDGVKDMMKFYFNSHKWGNYPMAQKENIEKILVTDYYSQKGIDGTKAYYVIGSDIYGPMGNELIPFASLNDAKTFQKDHSGKRIIQFSNITEDEVYGLDVNE